MNRKARREMNARLGHGLRGKVCAEFNISRSDLRRIGTHPKGLQGLVDAKLVSKGTNE